MRYKNLHSGRFILSAEQRAKRIVQVTRQADISLCKGFWNLSEEGLYYVRRCSVSPLESFVQKVPNWLGPSLAVNSMIKLGVSLEPQWVQSVTDEQVKIPIPSAHTGPRPVKARLLSVRLRPGQVHCSSNTNSVSENILYSASYSKAARPHRCHLLLAACLSVLIAFCSMCTAVVLWQRRRRVMR